MSPFLVLCGLVAGLALVVSRIVERAKDHVTQIRCAPANESHWLWGHELSIWKHQASVKYLDWTVGLGPFYRIKASFFQRDIIVAGDHLASHHILSNASLRCRLCPGEEHKHQRRLIAPAFTLPAVKDMGDDVVECAQKFVQMVTKHVTSQGGASSVNIGPFVSACTLDIIGRIAFGHDFGCGTSEEARNIITSWHKDVLLSRTIAGFLAPIIMCTFPWITKLPIPALQTDGVAKRVAIKLAGELLRNNRAELESGDGKDILSILKIMVGHETTSCTVSFTLYELARHPAVQQKLRQEVSDLSDFSYDSINALPYLDAVSKEGLRVHPAAASTDRVALSDDIIPLAKPLTTIDGTMLTSIPVFHIPMGAQNLTPAPERWIEAGGIPAFEQLPYGPYAGVSSFLDGQRACIGWRLAVYEFKVMLALVVRDLEFSSTQDEVEGFIAGTLQPIVGEEVKMPVHVRLLTSAPQ
ncbi:cytochrome P450 [Mucidula mucida]|nr:cytochrome P450 [Mucidula mucida]